MRLHCNAPKLFLKNIKESGANCRNIVWEVIGPNFCAFTFVVVDVDWSILIGVCLS